MDETLRDCPLQQTIHSDFIETVENFDQPWLLLKSEFISSGFIISSAPCPLTLQDKKNNSFPRGIQWKYMRKGNYLGNHILQEGHHALHVRLLTVTAEILSA